VRIAAEVEDAIARGTAVALETTIFSGLGLPDPHGAAALERCSAAIRRNGGVPALTAVIDGEARIGIDDPDELDRIYGATAKVASRDLSVAVGERWPVGVTTVSASLQLAALAGIRVFATGGIGGVHRDVERTGDVSADLLAIRTFDVVTVCAGAKAFLDIPRTLEQLETWGVPVVTLGSDDFPAFTTRSSGVRTPRRVDSEATVAAIVRAARELDYLGGVLVAVPIDAADEVPRADIDAAIATATEAASAAGITGPALTPFVLDRIATATGGRSVPANLALAEQNAAVAARIAVELHQVGV
jgi:pseudouridine-5'-phosphate glycosidase